MNSFLLQIWSHLLKKSVMQNVIFWAVKIEQPAEVHALHASQSLQLNVFSTYYAWLTKTVQSRRLKHWKVSLKRHPVSIKRPYILKHTYDLLVDTRYNRFKNRDTRIISQIYSKSAIRIPFFIPSYNMFRMLYCFC